MSSKLSWPGATMRAVVYPGTPFEMTVQDVAKPTVLNGTDVVMRMTTSALCGSDLHVYRGYMGGAVPWTMGHEAVSYVLEVGDAVSSFVVGDYPGDSVAVFRAGPIGLLSAYSAILRGASKGYVIDYLKERLQLAAFIRAILINFTENGPVA
ncbi:chaperonin 10-like protein [Colletotrichum cereale]|nr:chaperonin 10-like protein [Colletotrichum cereale]